ncbi:alpha-2-macroglobulin family protein [Psychroserpens ponticola]|uniref:MG2 domain-containing protein n=1 Tax=Psychroserpens ponticola TaxID=2932268 RepID=A0ABY7RXK5_9FLAO|nr:alpha-2-macroglobulin family protein [Psychroserpens ponticola]WCO00976.1 MG2 domain-containing protein [Psychroserpens ponticola]
MKLMTNIIMILCFANFAAAQSDGFDKLWKDVLKHESDGLPKSALKVVETITELAKTKNNTPQQIKALLHKSKYLLTLEEDAQLKIVEDFKTEISKSKSPTKNILENMLATMYWHYFQQHRYQFYNRTNTSEKVDADFRTWDLQTLFTEIQTYYQSSLQNGLILQQTQLSEYKDIIQEENGSKVFRPTLFDLLSHNALQFYTTNENSISKPAYKFEIDNANLLGTTKVFTAVDLRSNVTTSLQLQALKIYQELIQFHSKGSNLDALADVDLKRLKYVAQHAIFDNKETLLLQTLQKSSDQWSSNPVSGLYDFEIATIWHRQGNQYNVNTNPEVRWKLKDAIELCDLVITKFPKSSASEQCEALKSQIHSSRLNLSAETVIPINSHSRFLVKYTNIEALNFKIYNVNFSQKEAFDKLYRPNERLAFLKNKTSITEWKSTLKNEGDYQNHTTEVVVPKLENGHYIILAETPNKDHSFATQTLQVTDFAVIDKSTGSEIVYQIIDRKNGNPIANVAASLKFQKNYNNAFYTNNLTSDTNGEIRLKKTSERYYNLSITLSKNNNTAFFNGFYTSKEHSQNDKKANYNSFLFTDRSIYRPGQTVYFKAIVLESEIGKSKPLSDEIINANLYNVNGEKLSELELKSNDYGSIAGEFILPNSGLNGQHYIQINSTKRSIRQHYYFSVEDYKRPKFETKFNPVTETYKINDSVIAKGTAIAYAGSNITDAKVVFRVVRKVKYPRWYYWYRPWFNSEPQEISHGETTTNDKGEFEIAFKALPDESADKHSLPVFNYEITADVTDLNGETRSATTIINVGYHAMEAKVSIDEQLDTSKKDHKLSISTKNLNGEFVPAEGHIKIYKLIAPNRVLRPRPWNAPDFQVIPSEEFKTKFPHEAYTNEQNPIHWKKGTLVFENTFDTESSNEMLLGNIKKWSSGQYVILLESTDKFGQKVTDETRTTLFSDSDKTVSDQQLFSITTNQDSYNQGQNVALTLGSSAKDITVTLSIEKDSKIVNTYIIPLSNNKKTIAIPVTKDDIGGFAIHYSYAAFNSFSGNVIRINVPYPKSDLQIETTTFRDKLQPGTDETWSFKIKGSKGEKVTAEILASMYDMSLDQFKPHAWSFNPIQKPTYYPQYAMNARQSFGIGGFRVHNQQNNYPYYQQQQYDQLNWFGFYFGNRHLYRMLEGDAAGIQIVEDDSEMEEVMVMGYSSVSKDEMTSAVANVSAESIDKKKSIKGSDADSQQKSVNEQDFGDVIIRKNLQETAFFFPQLQTDNEGQVSFSFTTPEALTKWKLQLLAHTKTMESATSTLESVTQKELMVIPNAPRFLRQGDDVVISTKISNLTEKELIGQARLILTDATTGQDISYDLIVQPLEFQVMGQHYSANEAFSVNAKGNTQVSWTLKIPNNIDAVQYKILAKAGDYSDGEQSTLPVLTNRMLVTETLPMWIKGNESRTFTLDKLRNNTSTTLKHHKLTLEMTSNPAWYAVQALPYLMEYPYECNEQTFSRYYANALASHIANSNPKIQAVFNQWKNADVLISNLEKNEELKSILIQETPWLRDAQSETEQKKRIALLFDLNKMNYELDAAKRKLKNNQMPNGAWPWFKGGRANRYITQHIITGFTHLEKLNVTSSTDETQMINKAISYLDTEFLKEYKDIRKYNPKADLSRDHLTNTQLQYLYLRSFLPNTKKSKEISDIMDYYFGQIKTYWLDKSLYSKGLMALIMHRQNDSKTAGKILKSLEENSITSDELGMYWKANTSSWNWYQAPIETQALLIEAFSEVGPIIQSETKHLETIDNLKIWLLKNKQTNQWKTTKATTEAVYALLLQGSDWLSVTDMVDVVIGGKVIAPSKLKDVEIEAGTGYYKTSWTKHDINPSMATVELNKKGEGIAWGSLYWQYFEDLDKITSAETPLKLKKKLFKKTHTNTGEQITEITSDTKLNVGDLVRVRIELRSDRNMEFIHMKDMRASGLEPINVMSQYKWQDGLGYYESTKDASTNFFFDYLPKGVYVFEYDLRVNNAGNMSNGITTIQSMYAPEFSSHSEGVRIMIQ